jgi:hypothetical protein
MSHFKAYECKVDNLEYVRRAINEMGYDVVENTTIVDWAKQSRKVALAVVDKDGKLLPLGFAVAKDEKGNTELQCIADWFMTPFGEKDFTNKVAQLHDKYRAIDICEENRWNVDYDSITVNEHGEIEFLATQWA